MKVGVACAFCPLTVFFEKYPIPISLEFGGTPIKEIAFPV
jgi:hypothetical protein